MQATASTGCRCHELCCIVVCMDDAQHVVCVCGRGVFGPLVELFSCIEQMNAAVEVTAGNQLFNVVVDTDGTSTTIIKYLNSSKGGRVTFMPLNRIQVLRCLVTVDQKGCVQDMLAAM